MSISVGVRRRSAREPIEIDKISGVPCWRLFTARAEFTTLRMRLIKIGARIAESASRVRIAFAAAHPEATLFASLARCIHPAGQ